MMRFARTTAVVTVSLVLASAWQARAEQIAYTDFDEPSLGDHTYTSVGGELGFTTTFSETQGPIEALGVFDSASAGRVFRLQTVQADTTFDTVDLSQWENVSASLVLRISNTSWEPGDFFSAVLDDGGAGTIDLVNLIEMHFNGLPHDMNLPFSVAIPDAWTQATLTVSGFTNSSADAEILDYDSIQFAGDGTGPTLTQGPYLQMGTENSIVVRWQTDPCTDSQVSYGADPSTLTNVATDATCVTDHEIALSGLTADTKYYYAVGTTAAEVLAGGDAVHFFATSPPVGTAKPTRVWVIGDSGTGNAAAQDVRDAYLQFTDPLVPFGSTWLYWQSGDPGPGWMDPLASEAGWGSGPARLGFGDDGEVTLLTSGQMTYYFRHHLDVADPAAIPGLTVSVVRDDGAVVYLNGTEVFRTNMAASGPIAHDDPALVNVNEGAEEAAVHSVEVDPGLLVANDNVLAVEVHQSTLASSDVGFDLELTGMPTTDAWLMLGDNAYNLGTYDEYGNTLFAIYPALLRNAVLWPSLGNHDGYSASSIGLCIGAGPDGTADTTATFTTPQIWDAQVTPVGTSGLSPTHVVVGTGTDGALETLPAGDDEVLAADVPCGPYYDHFVLPTSAEAGGEPSATEAYYSFDYGNIHFIALDSWTAMFRVPGSDMLTWLANDLANTTQDWIIAYWHHAPYTKGSHDSDTETALIEMRENALRILEGGGVDLVLSGHSHTYERSLLIDCHYTSSGDCPSGEDRFVDVGDGDPNGDGAYEKPLGPAPHEGAIYAVIGSSGGQRGACQALHPVMHICLSSTLSNSSTEPDLPGSLVLDVDGDQLEARFLDHDMMVKDHFVMIPEPGRLVMLTAGVAFVLALGRRRISAGEKWRTRTADRWKDRAAAE